MRPTLQITLQISGVNDQYRQTSGLIVKRLEFDLLEPGICDRRESPGSSPAMSDFQTICAK